MRSKLLGVMVACVAFAAGVLSGSVHREPPLIPAAAVTPAPETPAMDESPAYPESLGLTPSEIASFINEHPQANLAPLWERLKINNDDDPIIQFSFGNACGLCEAHISIYNLDNDVAREIVLQIKQQYGEAYRYLIFKDSRDRNPKFLGKIDGWAKYTPADPVVLANADRTWFIVQSTAATGSGLAAWLDRVYEVSDTGVRQVASYLGEVSQSGELGLPAKRFVARPVSCEIKNGWATLKLAYVIEYSIAGSLLFRKQQTVVLVQSIRAESSFVVASESNVTPHEFETIYNFDLMGPEEFLRYNQAELRAIATGNESARKTWLKEFLGMCANSAIKRELSALLE